VATSAAGKSQRQQQYVAAPLPDGIPAGLVLDPQTNMYYDPKMGYYWDVRYQLFYDGVKQVYLQYDTASKAYIPVPTESQDPKELARKARERFHQISLVSPRLFFLLVHSGRSRSRPWGASLRSAIVPSGCGIPKK
jgi:hypothetical protein